MKVTYNPKTRELTIVAVLAETPSPSTSGKTLVVASTRGNLKTGVKVPGPNGDAELTLGLNAYIPKA